MSMIPKSLAVRPRLLVALGVMVAVMLVLPWDWRWSTRWLIAWDAAAIAYLALIARMMFGETVEQIRRRAAQQDEGALAILFVACFAAAASIAAIGVQLAGMSDVPAADRGLHLALGAFTILCSWTLMHAFFTLHYAHDYYDDRQAEGGLDFPGDEKPTYLDFLYFSFTIGCTSQTSDVGIQTRPLRLVALLHSVLSFFFNTTILALGINVGASLVSGN